MNDVVPTSPCEAAKWAYSLGWSPVPIPWASKGPNEEGWQNRRLDPEDAERDFAKEFMNVGVMVGADRGGAVDIDCDWTESVALAPYFLPDTGLITGRHQRPCSHYWFQCPDAGKFIAFSLDPEPGKTRTDLKIIEVRSGDGKQTVVFGRHPEGDSYCWNHCGQPATVAFSTLVEAAQAIALGSILLRFYPQGGRHDLALAVTGWLLAEGWTKDRVRSFVRAVASCAGDEEIDDRLRAVDDTASKFGDKHWTEEVQTPLAGFGKIRTLIGERAASSIDRIRRQWKRPAAAAKPHMNGHAKPETGAAPKFILKKMDDLDRTPTEWIWKNRIAAGELHILCAVQGTGKSAILNDIAARITRGDCLPFSDLPSRRQSILFIDGEQGENQIWHRWNQANVDPDMAHLMVMLDSRGHPRPILLDTDYTEIEAAIEQIRPALVIIDPVGGAMSRRTDANNEANVREMLDRHMQIARRFRCAYLLVAHPRKSTDSLAVQQALGSTAWSAMPRVGMIAAKDTRDGAKDQVLLAITKSNLGRMPPTSVVRISPSAITDSLNVEWVEEDHEIDADGLMAMIRANTKRASSEYRSCSLAEQVEKIVREAGSGGVTARELTRMVYALRILEKAEEALQRLVNDRKAEIFVRHAEGGGRPADAFRWLSDN